MDTNINREEIFSSNRNELFLSRLSGDIEKLESIGLNKKDIKTILSTFAYVRVWANTPNFLYPALKLPKGYTWKSGEIHKVSYSKVNSKTYIFLPIDKDLYIKGFEVLGTNITDSKIAYIKDYKNIKGYDILKAFCFDIYLKTELLNFWYENKLSLGFVEPILKPLEGRV